MIYRALVGWVLVLFLVARVDAQALQGTAFTYQGELTQNGVPLNGSADLVFELFDAPTGGNTVAPALAFTTANGNPATVSNGIFSIALDFGATAFAGPVANARWLRVTANGNVLAPRTKVESAPFALLARNAELAFAVPDASIGAAEVIPAQVQLRGAATSCASGNYVRAIEADGDVLCASDATGAGTITGVSPGFGLTGGGTSGAVTLAVDANVVQARGATNSCVVGMVVREITASGNVVCVGDANSGGTIMGVTAGNGLTGGGTSGTVSVAADTNVVQRRVVSSCPAESSIRLINTDGSVVCEGDSFGATGTGWALSGNAGTTAGANYVGTTDAQALELKVQGARAMRFEPTDQTPFSGQVNVIGGAAANTVTAGAKAATIAGGGSADSIGANRVTDNYGVVSGGTNNRAGNDNAAIGDAFSATVGGGSSNVASGDSSTISGGTNNTASGTLAVIAGGQGNSASATRASIGGGVNNIASATGAAVSGGNGNTASGISAIVTGGSGNAASAPSSIVAGGNSNSANAFGAAVLGGTGNVASGLIATVAGGTSNRAGGDFSFAAGRLAVVRDLAAAGEPVTCDGNSTCGDEGTFMFADSNNAAFSSDGPNRFLVRATGGVRFVSAIDGLGNATTGVQLAAGGGSWSTLSDRDAKTDFASIDPLGVLERVLALPISRWRYRAQDASVRHLGPMAQDFRAAFGLGDDERHITTVDADGVALAAIQGLNAKLEAEVVALEASNARLAEKNARLATEQAALAARLAEIEASLRAAEAR